MEGRQRNQERERDRQQMTSPTHRARRLAELARQRELFSSSTSSLSLSVSPSPRSPRMRKDNSDSEREQTIVPSHQSRSRSRSRSRNRSGSRNKSAAAVNTKNQHQTQRRGESGDNTGRSQSRNQIRSPAMKGRLIVTRDGRHVFVEEAAQPSDSKNSNANKNADSIGHEIDDNDNNNDNDGYYDCYGNNHELSKSKSHNTADAFEDTMASLAALIGQSSRFLVNNKSGGMSPANDVCVSCRARKQIELVDSWRPSSSSTPLSGSKSRGLLTRAQQQTSTDKTLLALIEQERAKYLSLESTHTTLLANLSHLQQAHRADVSRLQASYKHALNSVKLEAREKEARVARTIRSLVALLNRHHSSYSSTNNDTNNSNGDVNYKNEAFTRINSFPADSATEFLLDSDRDSGEVVEILVSRVDSVLRASIDRSKILEEALDEMRASKRLISDKLSFREQEMKKLAIFAKEKDQEFLAERDHKMKLEMQILHLERGLHSTRLELEKTNELYRAKSTEAQELATVKDRFESTRKTLDDVLKREKMYLEEIEVSSSRERRLCGELDSLNKNFDKKRCELEDAMTDFSKLQQKASEIESRLRQDINDGNAAKKKLVEHISALEVAIKSEKSENQSLSQKASDLVTQINDLTQNLKINETELSLQRQTELDMRREIQTLVSKGESASLEIQGLEDLTEDLKIRLDKETESKSAMQKENTARLAEVAEKIAKLQQSLNETQAQLNQFEEIEQSLRLQLRQKDEMILSLQKEMSEMEQQIHELNASLQSSDSFIESIKVKKKEELIAVQERFGLAKNAMETEVTNLRNQLSSKSALLSQQGDEIARVKIEVSELTADRFRLEARCAELIANESSNSRQISNVTQLLRQKEQDLAVMAIKHEALVEQVHLLEDELRMYRNTTLKHDTDQHHHNHQQQHQKANNYYNSDSTTSNTARRHHSELMDKSGKGSALNLFAGTGRQASTHSLSRQPSNLSSSKLYSDATAAAVAAMIAPTPKPLSGLRSRTDLLAPSRSGSSLAILANESTISVKVPSSRAGGHGGSAARKEHTSIDGLEDFMSGSQRQ